MPQMWSDDEWEAFLLRFNSTNPLKTGASTSITEAAVRLDRMLREIEHKLKKGQEITPTELDRMIFRRKDLMIQVGLRAT